MRGGVGMGVVAWENGRKGTKGKKGQKRERAQEG